ncbi:Group 4 capsule polysaccharide lipoprotein gfcB, YjbF [Roseivivax lentus]|uniref:Group 4 capsule polysaccharide lipoprotein gfcB, YjbF n=1 Tax=Roseivivax lentus TaxID=633194 RepID=A0A1N7P6E1_9RHOB|nr:YjbF family lipoprotein [Roseivivax lentus]SIT06205.1 Group 4 capsule polysaccharide lipoprotein gfcB, YjbF [Roseivivax lentus]
MTRIIRLFLLTALLAACTERPPLGTLRAGLTPEIVATVENELLYIAVEGIQTESTVQPAERLYGVINWRTLDNFSEISTRNGVIVATRSLGDDLMSADVTGTIAALQGRDGGDYYPRFHTMLDGEYQPYFESFQCIVESRAPETLTIIDRTYRTTRIEEVCATPERTVTNRYWVGSDGTVLRSRQWIGESVAHIQTERLK